jgi:ribosomal-protein-alanine N-acetyltransferase
MRMNRKDQHLRVNGKRVFLRYVTLDDFEEMMEMFRQSRRLYRGFYNPPSDRQIFESYVGNNELETNECFVICRREDGRIVGTITLSQIFRRAFQNAYLGYALGEPYTGQGYMTEAINLVLRYAFKTLKLHRLEANIQPHNTASINVVERCGFSKEGYSPKYLKIGGRWCDHERWAIVRENWKPK